MNNLSVAHHGASKRGRMHLFRAEKQPGLLQHQRLPPHQRLSTPRTVFLIVNTSPAEIFQLPHCSWSIYPTDMAPAT